MNVKNIFYITGVSILLTACSSESESTTSNGTDIIESNEAEEGLELNNGKKWKVVEGMLPPILVMSNSIESFDGSSLEDYQSLGDGLMVNVNKLTSSCSMTGKAHDILHVWLLPYIDLVDQMSHVKSTDEGKTKLMEIKASIKSYNTYFE